MMKPSQESSDPKRVAGLDVARGLAIFGMVVVHFQLVMTDGTVPAPWAKGLLQFLDGRPAATFMMLAGMGIAMLAENRDRYSDLHRPVGSVLRRRGVFLLVCGFLNLMIWEGDILRVYGVCLIVIPSILRCTSRALVLWICGIVLTFCAMMASFDYGKNWNFSMMHYQGLWTLEGSTRSLFYDGFRAVFPWSALLILGLGLGRMDWRGETTARRAVRWGLLLWVFSGLLSFALCKLLGSAGDASVSQEDIVALFGLQSMPPLPLFLASATGVALVTIGLSVIAASRWGGAMVVRGFAATGRMAFTWYLAHIVIGLGGLIAIGWLATTSREALLAALMFFTGATAFSILWLRKFRHGPLEWVLRKLG